MERSENVWEENEKSVYYVENLLKKRFMEAYAKLTKLMTQYSHLVDLDEGVRPEPAKKNPQFSRKIKITGKKSLIFSNNQNKKI